MKRILITWKSNNGVVMGAKVEDDVDTNTIQEELNNAKPSDPTEILTKYIEKSINEAIEVFKGLGAQVKEIELTNLETKISISLVPRCQDRNKIFFLIISVFFSIICTLIEQ